MDHLLGLMLIFSHRPIFPLEPGVLNLHGHVHDSPTPELGASHVNLCVEVRDYRPRRLGEILASYYTLLCRVRGCLSRFSICGSLLYVTIISII